MKPKLHIAYVCADRGVPIGGRKGASAHVAELTRALVARGAEVRLMAARANDTEGGGGGIRLINVGADRGFRLARQAIFAGTRGDRQQAGAAEAHSLMINSLIAKRLEQLHRRWHIDAIYERYSLWSFAAANFARVTNIPYILEVNAPLRQEQRRYRILENFPLAATLESYLLRSADCVIVPASDLHPYLVRRGARPEAVKVIPNAADPELFGRTAALRAPRTAESPFVIGFLGTLKPWHGLVQLMQAFRQLHRRSPRYRLLIAGDGPLREELESRAIRFRLQDSVTFTGEVAHQSIAEVLAQMDVAVAPYPRLPGFYFSPLKVFEYMAAGVPVVASAIGQLDEILTHRRNALLHRAGSVVEMVEQIDTLRRHPKLAAQLVTAARRLVARRYTWEGNADQVVRLIAHLQRHSAAGAGRKHDGSR